MSHLLNFYGECEVTLEGVLRLSDRRTFCIAMRRMKPGPKVIRIEEPPTQRTLDQNAFLHAAVFPLIAAEVGDSVEGVKYDLMGEKWGWKPSPINPQRMVPVRPSTASMTKAECSEFIEWLFAFALHTWNMTIQSPDEWLKTQGAA